jgi:hypothetical protein
MYGTYIEKHPRIYQAAAALYSIEVISIPSKPFAQNRLTYGSRKEESIQGSSSLRNEVYDEKTGELLASVVNGRYPVRSIIRAGGMMTRDVRRR